jgi:predicted  nucleic acid-binding Zn-ribbon protein
MASAQLLFNNEVFMNQLQALYHIQQLELQIDEAKNRVDAITDALENDEVLQEKRAALQSSEAMLHQAQGRVTDLELDIQGIETRIQEGDELLYSGKIKNPKELQERQDEIESLKRRRATRQDELVHAREALKAAATDQEQAAADYQTTREERELEHEDLVVEQKKLKEKMTTWLRDRKKSLKEVDDTNHKIYKKLKSQKNGIAIARLDDSTCTVCRVEQYQNIVYQVRQGDGFINCHNCGRILVEI